MVGTVFMGLSKAFDCLPHGLIIAKLHAFGLSLNACDLFSSYLCNRFLITSHSGVDASNATLQIDDSIVLTPEPEVKVLGVTLDNKLNFNHHVSATCTKATRQFNALARISRVLSTSSRIFICNSFINRNFDYCPIVLYFCGKIMVTK